MPELEVPLGYLAAFVAGPLVVGAGVCVMVWRLHRLAGGVRVPAVVVRFERRRPSRLPHPVVRFRTLDGRVVETRSWLARRRHWWFPVRPGQQVTVLYDRARPERAAPEELVLIAQRGVPVLALVVAVFALIGGVAVVVLTGTLGPGPP